MYYCELSLFLIYMFFADIKKKKKKIAKNVMVEMIIILFITALANIPFYLSIVNYLIPRDIMECMALTRAEWQKETI